MIVRKVFLPILFLVQASAVMAQVLPVSKDEQLLLGIEVQTVAAIAQGVTGEISMRVGFAPDGEWVIKTPLSGILHRVFVQEGSRVSAGDPLVIVRSAGMVDLQRDFLRARAEVNLQKSVWTRDNKLREAGSVSERRWQDTRFKYDAARAEYAGLRGQLVLAGLSGADLAELSLEMDISPDIILRAPADAIVLERSAKLGDQLDGSELLVRLGEPDNLVLEGLLSRKAAAQLAEGTRIALRDGDARAEIVFVSSVIDPETQTVLVRAEPRHAAGLLPGQLTHWKILSAGKVLSVPSSAVVKLDGRDVVYLATATGFEVREVQVNSTGSGAWIVQAGLLAGDRIAITGTAVLKGMSLGMGGGDD